jgi:hypothetical protein
MTSTPIFQDEIKEQEQEKKQLLGSQLFNSIQKSLTGVGQSIVKASEDDPDTWTDDAIRLGLGGAKNVGNVLNAPGIRHALQALGAPAWIVGQGLGWTLEKAGVDPRYGHVAGEVGEWFIPFYGAGKLVKKAKQLSTNISRLADMTPMQRALASGTVAAAKPVYKKTDILKQAAVDTIGRDRVQTLRQRLRSAIDGKEIQDILGLDTVRRSEAGDVIHHPLLEPDSYSYKTRVGPAIVGQGLKPAKTTTFNTKVNKIMRIMTGEDSFYPRQVGEPKLREVFSRKSTNRHHPAPLKQTAAAVDYLTDEGLVRGVEYLEERIGHRLGDFQTGYPAIKPLHDKLHDFLNSRLGTNKDLLYKLEKKYFGKKRLSDGIDVETRISSGFYDELAEVIVEQEGFINDFHRSLVNAYQPGLVSIQEFVDSAAEIAKVDKRFGAIMSGTAPGQTATDMIKEVTGLTNTRLAKIVSELNSLPAGVSKNTDGIRRLLLREQGPAALKEIIRRVEGVDDLELISQKIEQTFKDYGIRQTEADAWDLINELVDDLSFMNPEDAGIRPKDLEGLFALDNDPRWN